MASHLPFAMVLLVLMRPSMPTPATFGANIALPTGGSAGPIQLAIAINGEPVSATQMIVTPAAVGEFFNVSRTLFLNVPSGCCAQISVENTSTVAIDVQNASLIVERVA